MQRGARIILALSPPRRRHALQHYTCFFYEEDFGAHYLRHIAIPAKVENAFKAYLYVPYSALSVSARLRSIQDDDDVFFNPQGKMSLRKMERKGEANITMVEWRASARIAEDRILFHHGVERAAAFTGHHLVVEEVAMEHGWSLAVKYDILQRELAAADVSHDVSSLHISALMKLQLQAMTLSARAPEPFVQQASPRKRAFQDTELPTPHKRIASAHCFRCGGGGHFPGDCTASSTVSGRIPAALAKGPGNKHAMLAPNGKQFCFSFARGRCSAGDSCSNSHACSICGDANHGAGRCKSVV